MIYYNRSLATGNCLFSSISLRLYGDNSSNEVLRLLTAIELYLHAEHYSKHPVFVTVFSQHNDLFCSLQTLLTASVSDSAFNTDLRGEDLVRAEAVHICESFRGWSAFLSILALSSVVGKSILCYYPDFGLPKYKILFNQRIDPRLSSGNNSFCLHILFCYCGILPIGKFSHNHYVPLVFNNKQASLVYVPPFKKICLDVPSSSATSSTPSTKSGLISCSNSVSKSVFKVKPLTLHSFFQKSGNSKQEFPDSCVSHVIDNQTSNNNIMSVTSKSADVFTDFSDIASLRVDSSKLTEKELYNRINNIFQPNIAFSFPKSVNGRRFCFAWLQQFSWVRYSVSCDGAFCLPCVLFGAKFPGQNSKIKILFSKPLQYWNDATRKLKEHENAKNGMHQYTMLTYNNFMSQMRGETKPISVIVDKILRADIEQNRKILAPIIDSVILCGRTNTPLRGHRDDSKYHPEVGGYSEGGVGNFIELLNYAVRRGDVVLEEHLKNPQKNARYTSKTMQNKLIDCCGAVVTEKILDQVKRNKFFSILGDEVSDTSFKEQFSLVLRYVDNNFDIREDFVRFIHCKEGLSGADLSAALLNCVENDLNLDISKCRGQGYDGAGAVAGHINGLSSHVLRVNPKALYVHCHNHRLNLCVSSSCNILSVRNVFDKVKEISYFFNLSSTRQNVLESSIIEHCPDSRRHKLKDVCRTRWVERIDGLNIFQQLFPSIVYAFQNMLSPGSKSNRDTKTKASTFLSCITTFEFVYTLVVTRHVFDVTLPVTQLLQAKSNDIVDGLHLISSLQNTFISMRNSIDFYHNKWFKEAQDLAVELVIPESAPRTCGRQQHRANIPSLNVSEYFRRAVFIPLVDHIKSDLSKRFDTSSVNAYNGLVIIPALMVPLIFSPRPGLCWKDKFKLFADFYADDVPSFSSLDGELELWGTYWETYTGSLPDNVSSTLKSVSFKSFENIKVLLRILGTLPVTSCECERSFSALRRLKDYSRSSMLDNRLNGLALLHVHQHIVPKVDEVIDKLCAMGETRLRFR